VDVVRFFGHRKSLRSGARVSHTGAGVDEREVDAVGVIGAVGRLDFAGPVPEPELEFDPPPAPRLGAEPCGCFFRADFSRDLSAGRSAERPDDLSGDCPEERVDVRSGALPDSARSATLPSEARPALLAAEVFANASPGGSKDIIYFNLLLTAGLVLSAESRFSCLMSKPGAGRPDEGPEAGFLPMPSTSLKLRAFLITRFERLLPPELDPRVESRPAIFFGATSVLLSLASLLSVLGP
jgi:hypothetical protein